MFSTIQSRGTSLLGSLTMAIIEKQNQALEMLATNFELGSSRPNGNRNVHCQGYQGGEFFLWEGY